MLSTRWLLLMWHKVRFRPERQRRSLQRGSLPSRLQRFVIQPYFYSGGCRVSWPIGGRRSSFYYRDWQKNDFEHRGSARNGVPVPTHLIGYSTLQRRVSYKHFHFRSVVVIPDIIIFIVIIVVVIIIIIIITATVSNKLKYSTIPCDFIFQTVAIETHGPLNTFALNFLNEVGCRLSSIFGDPRETSFLFQRLPVIVQRFNSVLIMYSFCTCDCGWLRSLAVTGNVAIRYSAYDVLVIFHRNCVGVVPFSSYSELFVESRRFFLRHVVVAPEKNPLEFHQDLRQHETRFPGLSSSVVA